MTLPVDFKSQAFFRDPAAVVGKLRAAGPLVEVRYPLIGRIWMTTTQDMAARVLKDPELFTMRKDDGGVAGMRWWMPRILSVLANNMHNSDEPDHTRLRGIVDEAFRRRAVLDMEPRIRAIVDELAADLFAQGSPADLVTRYARQLPLRVMCDLLGLPLDRPTEVHRLGGPCDGHRQRDRHPAHVPGALGAQALSGAATGARQRGRRRRTDRRACPARKGRGAAQPRRDGRHGVSASARGERDHHAPD